MIGFIGAGNMGSAIIKGMVSHNISPKDIFVYDTNIEKLNELKSLEINICGSNKEVIKKSKYVFLAIKPFMYDSVLHEIRDQLDETNVIISMAAGFDIEKIKEITDTNKITRIMPNTPALVGHGFTAVCFDEGVLAEEREFILNMLNTFGTSQVTIEGNINAYSAITGSSPAFVFMMIEALADSAVLLGLPRAEAYKAVEETILGSAALAIKTGKHPGELKDMVCSPAGTTIEGVRTLEEKGFRSALIECITNTYKKNLDIATIR